MAYATTDDVAPGRLGRAFNDADEEAFAAALLEDLEDDIKTRIPDLDAQVTAVPPTIPEARLVKIEARAVVRVLKNPDGYKQESDGDYAYTLGSALASGELALTADEWRQLGVYTRAFTIDTAPATAHVPWEDSEARYGWWR